MVLRLKLTRPMKTSTSILQSLKSSLLGLALLGLVAASGSAQAAGPKAYQFVTSGANTSGSITTLDNPALNGKPKLNLIVAHKYTVGYNNHALGLRYNFSTGKWQVQHEDGVAVPLGETINVLNAPGAKRLGTSAFTTDDYITYFPISKNKPNALLLATHVINPVQSFSGVKVADPFSTYFWNGQWSIYTDNFAAMKAAAFNIVDVTKLKANGAPASFLFTTTPTNISADLALIDNPLTNNKPNAVVFARHIWTSASPTYVNKEVGVYYNGSKWGIFMEDSSAMPDDAAFAVTVIPQATP